MDDRAGTQAELPLDAADELVWASERRGVPLTIVLEVSISGPITDSAIGEAVAAAAARYPKATVRLRRPSWSGRALHWQPGWPVPVGIASSNPQTARNAIASHTIDLEHDGATRVDVSRNETGDVRLLFAAHHAVMDGRSLTRFAEAVVAHLLNRAAANAGNQEPREVDSVSTRPAAVSPARTAWQLLAGPKPTRLSADASTPSPGQTFVVTSFTERTRELIAAARNETATVNDMLVAAAHLMTERWNQAHGDDANIVTVTVPYDLRGDGLTTTGNHAGQATTTSDPALRHTVTALVQAIHATIAAARREARHDSAASFFTTAIPIGLRRHLPRFGSWLSRDRPLASTRLSNLGVLQGSTWSHPRVLGVALGTPTRAPQGAAMGVVGLGDKILISVRACRTHFDDAGARRLLRCFEDALVDVATRTAAPV